MDNADDVNIAVETLAETERYTVWRAREPDDEIQYHLDVENVTLHFFQEEWDELIDLMRGLTGGAAAGNNAPRKPRSDGSGGKRDR